MNSYIHLEMIEVHLVTSALKPPPFFEGANDEILHLKNSEESKKF